MKIYQWSEEKSEQLKEERDIGFEIVIAAITNGHLLDTIDHPDSKKYPNQKIHMVEIDNYVYMVPFVEEKEYFFLKTIIPSRKMTKKYLNY